MHRRLRNAAISLIAISALTASGGASDPDNRRELLRTRETVWRAWFANDRKVLESLVPAGAIVISAGEQQWKGQAEVLQSAAQFHAEGGRLVCLDFPRTEIQRFGDVALVYSQYQLTIEAGGKQTLSSGRVTETFVRRRGKWINPGWHTDSEK